jgi:hypothetical protein
MVSMLLCFGGPVFWAVMKVLVALTMALVVVCCSGDGLGGGGF